MILDLVEERVRELLAAIWPEADPGAVRVEPARDKKHGDLATNAALVLAGGLRRPPREIAEEIAARLRTDELFDTVDVAGPGFINFFIAPAAWRRLLAHILKADETYGTSKRSDGRREQLEFVSANPTGPLNVVSARAAAVGDSLARLMEATGIEVDREFYVNDFGNQVDHLVDSVVWFMEGEKGDFPENGYRGGYVKDLADKASETIAALFLRGGTEGEIDGIDNLLDAIPSYINDNPEELTGAIAEAGGDGKSPLPVPVDSWRAILRRWILESVLLVQREDLASFGVSFDSWFRESRLHREKMVDATFEDMGRSQDVFEKDGAQWFRSTRYGDDDDRVLVRSDGRPTYFLADIAYHRDKANRGYDHAIDILGPDHHGHIPRMTGAMQALGLAPDWLEIFIVQQVNLMRLGKPIKMSKRAGDFISLRELLEEVGTDAARFFFVMLKPNSHLNFDLELAKSKSLDNPVYYVQYAHARVCSVFRHAVSAGIDPAGLRDAPLDSLDSAEDMELLRALDLFPDIVESSARTREPHRVPTYLKELASTFHTYYHKVKVVTDNQETTRARLALLEGVRIVLRNSFALLGVSAPDKM